MTARVGPPLKFPGSPRDGNIPKQAIREFRDSLFAEVCRLAGQEDVLAEMTGHASIPSRSVPTDAQPEGTPPTDPLPASD